MSVKNSVMAIPATAVDSAVLGGALQKIATLPNACFILRIINGSAKTIEVSYDGTTVHDYIAPNTTLMIPAQSNSQPRNNVALFAKGLAIWLTADGAGTGNVYISGYYQAVAN